MTLSHLGLVLSCGMACDSVGSFIGLGVSAESQVFVDFDVGAWIQIWYSGTYSVISFLFTSY